MTYDTPTRSYGYVRVSSIKQANNSSLVTQKKFIENFGIPPENIIEEIASSARNKLPEKKKLLRLLKNGDHLYVLTPCRFGRDFLHCEKELIELTAKGVHVYFGTQLVTLDDPQAVFHRRIQLLISWYDNAIRANRTKTGILVKKQSEKAWSAGRPCKMKINPNFKAKLVRHLDRKNPDGSFALSKKAIAAAMNVSTSTIYRYYENLFAEGLVSERGTSSTPKHDPEAQKTKQK